jgi:outer membrane receptor protein involved in Fe transport
MKIKFSILFVLATSISLFSQTTINKRNELSGTLLTNGNVPIADAVIQLLKAADSSLVKTEFSDDKGEFKFIDVKPNTYFVQTNVIGYSRFASSVFTFIESTKLAPFNLTKSEVELKEVSVTIHKPYIEREHGKMILNVENGIVSAGNSAFAVIEKAPGVRIDNNDNISFKGKQGVAVWIDGKPTPMTGSDLANYLKGMASNAIEKIEFISNPSAKYDAAGSSIINIKLKKDKNLGTNGSVSLAYGQGVYSKTNNGFTINHRDKKINVFASYNYAYRRGFNDLKLDRNFYNKDTFLGAYIQNNYLFIGYQNQIAKAGIDYFVNSKNTFGFVVNGVDNTFSPSGNNISQVYDNNNINTSRFETQNRSQDKWYNYSTNFNYKHTFDSTGTELTTDADYAQYANHTQQNFTTRYYDLNNVEYLNPYLLYGNINGSLNIYSIKSDLTKFLKNSLKIESGIKSSYVIADNNLAFYNKSSGVPVYDSTKSNHFIYQENINAAYINGSRDWKKISTQIGLRMEYTHVIGNQLVYNSKFDTNYVQLFPSAFIGYKLNGKNSLELNYSRRINRPSYDQLNPFKYYLDPTTYKAGNPYLQPETTHSFELSYIFNQKIYTTLGFGRTLNNIIEVIAPSPNQLKLTVQTNYNLAFVDVYTLNISAPIEVTKWWYTTNDISCYYAAYSGNVANTTINKAGNINFNINSVNSFSFSSTLSAELSGNYRAKEIYAFELAKPIWSVNAGLQKKLYNNKIILKLNISDILFTNNSRATTVFTGYVESYDVRRDTRVAVISFVYKFGNGLPSQRRKGGADDIKQRAGSSVG